MTSLLESLVPVLAILLVGVAAGRWLTVDIGPLSRFALYVLVGPLIFDSLYRSTVSLPNALGLWEGFALVSLALAAVAWLAGRLGSLPRHGRATLTAGALFPNTGNMGLSIALFALGRSGLDHAVIYLLGASVLMFVMGPILFSGGGLGESVVMVLRLPFIWAAVAGLLFHALHWTLPLQLGKAVHMLGQAAIPVELVILGMHIARSSLRIGRQTLATAALRLLAAPAIAIGVTWCLHLSPMGARVLILLSAMPVAVNTLLLSIEFGGDAERAGNAVVASTVLSFATLPLVLTLIPHVT